MIEHVVDVVGPIIREIIGDYHRSSFEPTEAEARIEELEEDGGIRFDPFTGDPMPYHVFETPGLTVYVFKAISRPWGNGRFGVYFSTTDHTPQGYESHAFKVAAEEVAKLIRTAGYNSGEDPTDNTLWDKDHHAQIMFYPKPEEELAKERVEAEAASPPPVVENTSRPNRGLHSFRLQINS